MQPDTPRCVSAVYPNRGRPEQPPGPLNLESAVADFWACVIFCAFLIGGAGTGSARKTCDSCWRRTSETIKTNDARTVGHPALDPVQNLSTPFVASDIDRENCPTRRYALPNTKCANPGGIEIGSGTMWLFTKHGFYSAVCARQGQGGHSQPVDPDRIMVRARIRNHLDALKQRFPQWLGVCEIREFDGTDYAYRLFVSKSDWVQVLAGLAEELDYDNFKSEVARYQGHAGAAYEHSLHDVWSVMNRLQK
jgi:hypothetical protein